MLKSLYNAIKDDAVASIAVEVDGRTYTSRPLAPVPTPTATPLTMHTLSGLKEYIDSNIDKCDDYFVHIETPCRVALKSKIIGSFRERETLAIVEYTAPAFRFNTWLSTEEFIIGLQSCFMSELDSVEVLRYVSTVKAVLGESVSDDGVSQTVTVKHGISQMGAASLPNPVTLTPIRYFPDIKQVPSRYVFRAKKTDDGIFFRLVEADGGGWEMDAIKILGEHLKELIHNKLPVIA